MMQHKSGSVVVLIVIALILVSGPVTRVQAVATTADCRPLIPAATTDNRELPFADALLWEVSRHDVPSSYIFGTIHVADVRVTRLPDVVTQVLNRSMTYVMEALPDDEEAMKLSQMMYFDDGRLLQDFIDRQLFERTRDILLAYDFTAEAIMRMKPWAAFLIMNYPDEDGLPLDLQLLHRAKQNGARLIGLETLSEQGEIFTDIPMEDQVRLLLDTVCNHDAVNRDFEIMKEYYLQRDLQGLYHYSNRYTIVSEPVYTGLLDRLLFERNERMVKRLLPVLNEGNAFIAVGAMHLPGDKGILSLLEMHGFSISPIY